MIFDTIFMTAILKEARLSSPVPLKDADFSRPFIYARFAGLFYFTGDWLIPTNQVCGFAWPQHYNTNMTPAATKHIFFRVLAGTCMYDPAVCDSIMASRYSSLNRHEHKVFGDEIFFIDQAKKVSDG